MPHGLLVLLMTIAMTGWASTAWADHAGSHEATDGAADSLDATAEQTVQPRKKLGWLRRTIRGFSYIDTNYVEPQHYNWSVMVQATQTYDIYRLRTLKGSGQSLAFSPTPLVKVGPYFGWRWVFLGYTFDLKHLGGVSPSAKKEFDFSIYAAQLGADLFYRRTGSDYKISRARFSDHRLQDALKGRSFDGLDVSTTGFNLYYIFNHQRFSYPAAFAQSTCQKISCGSWMAGIGYSSNSLSFDHERLQSMIDQEGYEERLDSALMFNSVKYTNYNASVGYAYNWVFAPRFLFCASLSMALAYKRSRGEMSKASDKGFDVKNFNVDGIGRFGLVFNNTRFYAGVNAVAYWNNYKKSRFAASSVFATVNTYVGYNFGKRSKYKRKK